jgi:hypothetical protein
MDLPRRQALALIAAGGMPALAGCTPCGETWTGIGFHVEPTVIEQTGGWRVNARLTVNFDFGRDGYGIAAPALALFGTDGALLAEAPVDGLMWSDVPEDDRRSDDCGEYATVERAATLESDRFPEWVGLRFDRFESGYDNPTTVSKYRGKTPDGDASSAEYERVDLETVGALSESVEYGEATQDVRFDTGRLTCEKIEGNAEAQTNVDLSFSGQRALPAEHYRPFLSDMELSGDQLTATIGLQSAPRFHRGDCLRSSWTATVAFADRESMPTAVEVKNLDTDGEVTDATTLHVETDTPES